MSALADEANGRPHDEKQRMVFCRSCGKEATVTIPANGRPYGWLRLTAGVPGWFNTISRTFYRTIGIYCSTACLLADIERIKAEEERHAQAYEHE